MPLGSPNPQISAISGVFMSQGHVYFQVPTFIYTVSVLLLMVSETQLKAFCDPFPSSPTPLKKKKPQNSKHSHKAFMSTVEFTEMWVEKSRAFHSKHQQPHTEHWAPLALRWLLISPAHEDFIWPSIPVFWLLSFISLLNSPFPLPNLL